MSPPCGRSGKPDAAICQHHPHERLPPARSPPLATQSTWKECHVEGAGSEGHQQAREVCLSLHREAAQTPLSTLLGFSRWLNTAGPASASTGRYPEPGGCVYRAWAPFKGSPPGSAAPPHPEPHMLHAPQTGQRGSSWRKSCPVHGRAGNPSGVYTGIRPVPEDPGPRPRQAVKLHWPAGGATDHTDLRLFPLGSLRSAETPFSGHQVFLNYKGDLPTLRDKGLGSKS